MNGWRLIEAVSGQASAALGGNKEIRAKMAQLAMDLDNAAPDHDGTQVDALEPIWFLTLSPLPILFYFGLMWVNHKAKKPFPSDRILALVCVGATIFTVAYALLARALVLGVTTIRYRSWTGRGFELAYDQIVRADFEIRKKVKDGLESGTLHCRLTTSADSYDVDLESDECALVLARRLPQSATRTVTTAF